MLKDTEVTEITGKTKEAILELAISYFGETAAVYGILILGAVLGAIAMRSFMSDKKGEGGKTKLQDIGAGPGARRQYSSRGNQAAHNDS